MEGQEGKEEWKLFSLLSQFGRAGKTLTEKSFVK